MVSQPIQEVGARLRLLVTTISQEPGIPVGLAQHLIQVSQCLSRYVLEMDYYKRKMADAWAALERR